MWLNLRAAKQLPGDGAVDVEHQPAYENADVQHCAIEAILGLCRKPYAARRNALGDSPAPGAATAKA